MNPRLVATALVAAVAALVPATAQARSEKVCPSPQKPGFAACHARVVTDASGAPLATTTPAGYGPADLQSAYKLPSGTNGTGQTIGIVDAYDLPSAQSDLNTYRSTYGLRACGTGCFRKVNQTGGTTPPRANAGWGQEIALDIDMASATCPNCNILLVEASSASLADLGTAVQTARRLGATVISNSYGGNEYSGEVTASSQYYDTGVPTTVSSGDSGYGVEFPAASQYVTAVGGTSLRKDASARGFTETAWSGAGSGCSAYIAKPTWQQDTGCAKRTVADVSAVADPATGVAVYDSTKYQGRSGWMVFGGTSVAAPVVAGVYALGARAPLATTYASAGSLFDVTSGSNGSCSVAYLCTAGGGFDGPTGLGTPNGVGAF